MQGLSILREIQARFYEADALSELMLDWQASARPRLAIFYGKQAVNTLQAIRSDIRGLSRESQQSFAKGKEKSYHTLAELLISQGRLTEAEQVLNLLKEEEYFEYIRRDSSEASSLNRRADLTDEEATWEKRYREIGDRLVTIGTEHGDLLGKPQSWIHNCEVGNRRVDVSEFAAWATACGVEPQIALTRFLTLSVATANARWKPARKRGS